MNTIQRIIKNTIVLLFAQIVTMGFGIFSTMYTARYLGTEGFGVLSFALALTGILGVFADLGFGSLTIREIARDKALANKYLGNISPVKVILSILTYAIIILVVNLINYPEQISKVVQFIALSVIFNTFTTMFYSIFQAFEKMEYISFGRIFSGILMLASIIIAINQHFDVVGFASIYFVISIINVFYCISIYAVKFSLPRFEFDWTFLRPAINASLPFFLSGIIDLLSFKIDIVMLSAMKGDATVGYYSAAFRLMEVLMFVPATFGGSIYPVLSKFYVSSQNSLNLAYKKSFEYLVIIGLPIAFGTTILAPKIIILLYGYNYSFSVIALQILIWNIPLIFSSYLLGTVLASTNRQPLAIKICIIGLLSNVIMNLILIPGYGLIGASIATLITSLLSLLLCFYFISRYVFRFSIYKLLMKIFISNIIMCLFILMAIDINIFVLISSSAVIYFAALLSLKTFSKEDIILVRQIFQGFGNKVVVGEDY